MNELSTSALATKQTIEPCNILIVGAGEVGQGLYDHMNEEVSFKDIGHLYDIYQVDPAKHLYPPVQKYDWLFITIPWSDKFVSYVEEYKEEYECNNVIIFSSVPIGTSRLCGAAHSPVEGRHPHLAESFYIFTRFLGGGNIGHYAILEAFFPDVVHVIKPEWTEFAKLSSTTLYGVNLEYARYRQSVCEELEMNYELLNQYDRAYNTLYCELEEERFVRYILDPPNVEGIKGHCILENAVTLNNQYPDIMVESVLALGKHPDVISEEKSYFNTTWLYCEHYGKKKSVAQIAREQGCTPENISLIMKRRGIKVRPSNKTWTDPEKELLIELLNSGFTFKEAADKMPGRTYESIRIQGSKMGICSPYDPGVRDVETRKKISASLQGLNLEDWKGFCENEEVKKVRRSTKYINWKRSIKERDNYTCCVCGATDEDSLLHVHHIIPISKDISKATEDSNGITLCIDCHWDQHRKVVNA